MEDVQLIDETGNKPLNPVWGFWATVGFGFWVASMNLLVEMLVLFVFIIMGAPGGGSIGLDFLQGLESNGLFLSLATIFGAIASVVVIVFVIKLKSGASIKEYLALRPIGWKTLLILLGIIIVFIVMFESLSQFINHKGSPINEKIYESIGWPPLFWLMAVVFAPLFEETLFRGFLFEGFLRSRAGLAGALLITSAVWAALHIQYGIFEIAGIFVLGLIIGFARWRTGSLWSPLLMHAFFNLTSTIAITLQTKG
jgi:uncharacterized protein